MVPVTGFGVARGGVATVGGVFADVTAAVPLTLPAVAVTMPRAVPAPAVNRPGWS